MPEEQTQETIPPGEVLQAVRCRMCGKNTQAIQQTGEEGNLILVAPPYCPHCGQALVFDVLGPVVSPEDVGQSGPIEIDTSDLDTRPLQPLWWEMPEAVPVIRVSGGAYGEAFDNGLDLRTVSPTGADGVITVADVEEALIRRALNQEVSG